MADIVTVAAYELGWSNPEAFSRAGAAESIVRSGNAFSLIYNETTDGGSGAGIISGVATVNGAPVGGTLLVLLRDPSGAPMRARVADADGAYEFRDLPAGSYAVVEIDSGGMYRAKVAHTVVP